MRIKSGMCWRNVSEVVEEEEKGEGMEEEGRVEKVRWKEAEEVYKRKELTLMF